MVNFTSEENEILSEMFEAMPSGNVEIRHDGSFILVDMLAAKTIIVHNKIIIITCTHIEKGVYQTVYRDRDFNKFLGSFAANVQERIVAKTTFL